MSGGISYENGNLKLDIDYILSAMSEEDLYAFVKSVALDDFIIQKVVDYICDEDEDGCWTGNSNKVRENILKRVEKKQQIGRASCRERV